MVNIIFPILSYKYKRRIDRTVLIVDLKGFPVKKLIYGKFKKYLLKSLKVVQDNHPEILKKVILINIPLVQKKA